MESLPQELIDKIISHLPSSDLRSSSLVARRWRRTSQKQAYYGISFSSQRGVRSWIALVQDDDHREIMSYVQLIEFHNIRTWKDPTLFCRGLMGLDSLSTLWVTKSGIPSGVRDFISREGFGGGITTLRLLSARATSSVMMYMILSFPNLQILEVRDVVIHSPIAPRQERRSTVPPVVSRKLEVLTLSGPLCGLVEALAEQLRSRDLFLDTQNSGALQLLRHSSEMVVKLTLQDQHMKSFPLTDLPSFPLLTSIVFVLTGLLPSHYLLRIARSISAPKITSITFLHYSWNLVQPAPPDLWDDVDEWLARTAEGTKIEGGFPLTLKGWPSGKLVWDGFLRKFREAGGQIETVPLRI